MTAEPDTTPRRGSPSPKLSEEEFKRRVRSRFVDPAFDGLSDALDAISAAAWDAYRNSRKSPHTQKAGPGYHDPGYDLATDWIRARDAIAEAKKLHDAGDSPPRILVINCSSRSEHTCPGEVSKSWRLAEIAGEQLAHDGAIVERLDLSRLASEYGRAIHPCKACFSTSPALCHWPCSCYPNYSLGQVHDWMNEIYPMWVRAHGVMIITPVNWYQTSSPLKLMMDRMVCADGGNPDPTLTQGKDAELAKKVEEKGWSYPRHLAGRVFSVIVHGDVEGAENVRRAISDWLSFMQLVPAGTHALLDRYIGYWKPYYASHAELDRDAAFQEEVRNAARTLSEAVTTARLRAGAELEAPRSK